MWSPPRFWLACIFCVAVVIFGSFFATNLFLAVLIDSYYEQQHCSVPKWTLRPL